jgi:hypothetical protein
MWELGQEHSSWYRAWLLLAPAFPSETQRALVSLTVGETNTRVLRVRQSLFGPWMKSVARCPRCADSLEFVLNTQDICASETPSGSQDQYETLFGPFRIRFRLLTARDVAEAAERGAVAPVVEALAERAVVSVYSGDDQVADLPREVRAALSTEISERDANSEIQIHLECPACAHVWTAAFDAIGYVWSEITVLAQRLLSEVHALAHLYGWAESDILSMSASRRHYYLNLAA